MPPPDSKVALQRFLGMVNYYRRFLPDMAHTLAPLHSAIGQAGRSKAIEWSGDCSATFDAAKAALTNADSPDGGRL